MSAIDTSAVATASVRAALEASEEAAEEAAILAAEAALLARLTPPPGVIRLVDRAHYVVWSSREDEPGEVVRGLYLAGTLHQSGAPDTVKPTRVQWVNGRELTEGSYDATEAGLVLLRDGTWEEWSVESGSWSFWQGATSHYVIARRAMTTAEVVREYDLGDILRELSRIYADAGAAAASKASALRLRRARLDAATKALGGAS